jgi:hypothetical protein
MPEQIWFGKSGNDLLVRLLASADTLTVEGWFTDASRRVEQFRLADGRQLLDTQVQALVSEMSKVPVAASTSVLATSATYANVKALVASSWA